MTGFCRGFGLALLATAVLAGCDRSSRATPAAATVGTRVAVPVDHLDGAPSVLPAEFGLAFFVPSDSTGQIVLVPGDTAADLSLIHGPVALMGRDGRLQTDTIVALTRRGACFTVDTRRSGKGLAPFSVGLLADSATLLPSDSLESLSPTDSAALSSRMTALASAVPGDSIGRFTGLPFVLMSLWRTAVRGGPTITVSIHRRQIPMEAAPLEERTLVIAERDSATDSYEVVYSERIDGAEETLETTDFVGVLIAKTRAAPLMLLARDAGDGITYNVLDRTPSPVGWKVIWESQTVHC